MHSTFRFSVLYLIAAVLLFSSCSKTNKQGRYIPKNAAMVVLVNGESISSKLPWAEVKQNELFKQLYQDSSLDLFIKTALDNPDNTGIDTKKVFLFFVQKDSIGGYVAMEGTLKDAAKFKQFNSQMAKGSVETEKNGIHFLSSDKITSSWDKEKFVIVIDAPEINDINKFSKSFDTAATSKQLVKRDGIAVCSQLFELKENNSLGKEAKFTDLVKTSGDIHFWMNIGEFNSGSAGMAALSMLNMSKLYEGSIATATANFENGKILLDMKSYGSKEMTQLWKKYAGSKVDEDMINRIPAKDVAVLVALNFKPEGIREFIKLAGMEGLVNMGSAFLGFNLDDFVKANKGDILFSLSDIKDLRAWSTGSTGNSAHHKYPKTEEQEDWNQPTHEWAHPVFLVYIFKFDPELRINTSIEFIDLGSKRLWRTDIENKLWTRLAKRRLVQFFEFRLLKAFFLEEYTGVLFIDHLDLGYIACLHQLGKALKIDHLR